MFYRLPLKMVIVHSYVSHYQRVFVPEYAPGIPSICVYPFRSECRSKNGRALQLWSFLSQTMTPPLKARRLRTGKPSPVHQRHPDKRRFDFLNLDIRSFGCIILCLDRGKMGCMASRELWSSRLSISWLRLL